MKNHFPQKSFLALFVGLCVSGAQAYQEQGQLGNTKSWESAEYQSDWGLANMHASVAYALGFNGSGVKLGVMDSGVKNDHPAFNGSQLHLVKTQGEYAADGLRYPDKEKVEDRGPYKKGEKFDIDGSWHQELNDSHGTHVSGTMVAGRDGVEMHGVAYGAELYSANTGGNDGMTYGPNQDYNYFYKGYSALADAGAKAINNSWGSNRRIQSAFPGAWGYWYYNGKKEEWTPEETASDPSLFDVHMNLRDLGEANKAYYQFMQSGQKNWLDAAYEVATERQIVQMFTAGNRNDMQESFTRSMLPYYRPKAENYWVNVTGNDQQDNHQWNMAGHSKYWTIAAPSRLINSARVDVKDGEIKLTYKQSSGTSMASPHVTAALGVIMQRYPYMTPAQAREVMLTTARNRTADGKTLEKWTALDGVPDERWGWGILDLGNAMFGPNQFLGTFDVKLDSNDLWANNISDKAIKFRQREDQQEAAEWATRKAELQAKSELSSNEKAELQVGLDREAARSARQAQGYQGSLIKSGTGTLTLAGNNNFSGPIQVTQGRLAGLNQAFGQSEIGQSSAIKVQAGAQLQVLPNVEFQKPTENGFKTVVRQSTDKTVNAQIEQGATFVLSNGVANLALKFAQDSFVQAAEFDQDQLKAEPQQVIYRAKGNFDGVENAQATSPYALYKASKTLFSAQQAAASPLRAAGSDEQSTLQVTLDKVTLAEIARSDNEAAIANAIQQQNGDLLQGLKFASPAQANATFDSLNFDGDLAAQQNQIVSDLLLRQQLSQPAALRAKLSNGNHIWANSSVGQVTNKSLGEDKLRSRSVNELVGADFAIGENSQFGAFFGATQSKLKWQQTHKARQLHLGLYGEHHFAPFAVRAGFIHSWGKTDNQIAIAQQKSRQQTESLFIEASHSGWIGDSFALETYAGAGYQHLKRQGFEQGEIRLADSSRDLLSASAGLRPTLPFALGGVSLNLQGDFAYHRFFHDNQAKATMWFDNQSQAYLVSEKLTNLLTAGVALQANFTPALSLKFGYQGAYAKDIRANGLNAQVKFSF